MKPKIKEKSNFIIRHYRIRKKVIGTKARPRLCLYPSIMHLEAQLINDFDQKTLFGMSTKSQEVQKAAGVKDGQNVKTAVIFGKHFAKQAQEKGIKKVVFDRGGFKYHGRVKAFADSAREAGLSF